MPELPKVAGFLSYANYDDAHDNGRITRLRERLQSSIRAASGIGDFTIFQDRSGIGWGEDWDRVIAGSLDAVVLLFPIVSPLWFSSSSCRGELSKFHRRQMRLGRDDLILPVYYRDTHLMQQDDTLASMEERDAAETLRKLQYEDWRALRRTDETDLAYGAAIERLAERAEPVLRHLRHLIEQAGPALASVALTDSAARQIQFPNRARPPGAVAVRIVDQTGRGDFTNISAALRDVPVGARILVRPGHYEESLLIRSPIELFGDGDRQYIVVQGTTSPALTLDTNISTVRNMTFRQSDDNFCVWVKQGQPTIEDCDLSSAGRSCLGVGGNASPKVHRNHIQDGKECGIFLYEEGSGIYENNDIFGNGLAGIEIKGTANPTIWRNRIHDGKQCGIYIHEAGRGTYEENDIFGNELAGIEVRGTAGPVVRRNRIHDGKKGGVYIHEAGRGTYEENDIFGNELVGIEARETADPVVRRNRVHDGKAGGILLHEEGSGTYEENDIFGNELVGIEVRGTAGPVVRRNRIHDGKVGGILLDEEGSGSYEENDIFGNELAGIEVRGIAGPVVRRNRIHDGNASGIFLHEEGSGTYEENDIFGNELAGIEVRGTAGPVVRRNRIHDGKKGGVYIHEAGRGIYEENEIFGSSLAGIEVTGTAAPVIRGNRIHGCGQDGIHLHEDAEGTYEGNTVEGNAYDRGRRV